MGCFSGWYGKQLQKHLVENKFMRCFFVLIVAILPLLLIGRQSRKSVQMPADCIFPVEAGPQFKGCPVAWNRFLTENMQAPGACSAEEFNVAMVVQFMVHKDGKVSGIQVLKASPCMKKELVRLIRLSAGSGMQENIRTCLQTAVGKLQ